MASTSTELPTTAKIKSGGDGLEAEAIGLEIPIRVHGSQMTSVLDATEHAEPFEENTSTMIVFPRGALIKLHAHVRTGHSLVVTNQRGNKTATCRIIQVTNPGGGIHYVKLEFNDPAAGFWGVHFPSEPLASTKTQEPEQESSSGSAAAPVKNEPAPALFAKPAFTTPAQHPSPVSGGAHEETLSAAPHIGIAAERDASLADYPHKGKGAYGAASHTEIEPLASVPHTPKKRTQRAAATVATFSRPAAVTKHVKETKPVKQKTIGDADFSGLISAAPQKKSSSFMKFAVAAAVILGLAAGGRYYLRLRSAALAKVPQYSAAQPAPPPAPVQASAPASTLPADTPSTGTNTAAAGSLDVQRDLTKPAAVPVRTSEPPASATSPVTQPVISNGTAGIYAGDLSSAKPAIRKRRHLSAAAPAVPSLSIPDAPNSDGANSLFAGNEEVPAPPSPAPKPAVVQGGHLQAARLIHSVPPTYPPLAAANHVEGNVILEAQIDALGKVTSAKVISGPVLLRSAALSALRQWKYSPAMLDGKAVATQFKVTVVFRLNR